MKMSEKFRIIVCLLLLTILSNQVHAGHFRGGEITWTCQGNGMFVFQLKYYRDCNGIAGAASVTLQTTVPAVPTIILDLILQQDISHGGFQSNGTTSCPTCVQGSSTNPISGLVEELIYESLPVQLFGVPPAIGWTFNVGECCRPALDNISNATGIGYGFQAKMYPYNNQNTQVCFDSSPFFVESPEPMFCTGYQVKYNQFAIDADRDSIVYSWGVPLTEIYGPIPFAPGYSVTSQLPGPAQNAANAGATLDPTTGAITFTSFTGGLFMTKVMVTSYKNGTKTAEIFREFMLTLNNNCPPVMGGSQNFPPVVNPPFVNPGTGLQTEYIDTIYAGDVVNFDLTFTDFDIFTNGTGQIISVEAAGDIFGLNFTDPTQGCTQPPCATFLTPLPASFPVAGNMTFNWATTEDHLVDPGTQTLNKKYNFTVTAKDNYCPSNGINTVTASIVILPRPLFAPPNLRCASVNTNGSVSLSWTPSPTLDTLGLFESYEIYAAVNTNGPFLFVDSVTAINATSYTHSAGSLTNMFGSNANQINICYYIRVKSYGTAPGYLSQSNTIYTMLPIVTLATNVPLITWYAISVPYINTWNPFFKIYREYPIGVWSFLDSTTIFGISGQYIDYTIPAICNDSISYRIELSDASGCIMKSAVSGILVNDTIAMATISPANPFFCTNGSVDISALPGYQYQWNTGATTQTINVNVPGVYTVIVSNGSGCTAEASTTVSGFNTIVPVINGNNVICQGQSTVLDAGMGYSDYLWNIGTNTQTITISFPGIYTVTVTDMNGCTGSDSILVTVNPSPIALAVAGGPTSFCQGDSVQLSVPSTFNSYQWYRYNTPVNPINLQSSHTVKTRGSYKCMVADMNGCTAFSNSIPVSVPCLPGPVEVEKVGGELTEQAWEIFPNPSYDDFYLKGPSNAKFVITDLTGKMVRFEVQVQDDETVLITGLNRGIYFLKLIWDENSRTIKLVKM